jgi:hypothetical protein
LRHLESAKGVIMGTTPEGDLAQAAQVLNELIPFEAPWTAAWQQDYYALAGVPQPHLTTRGILESHASAMAFAILESSAPRRTRSIMQNYIQTNRKALYRSLEDLIEDAAVPEPLDLAAILRLASFALGGSLLNIPGIPPPPDYLSSALPYVRYKRVLDKLPEIDDAAGHLQRSLNQPEKVEFASRMAGSMGSLALGGGLKSDGDLRKDWSVFGPNLIRSIAQWGYEAKVGLPDSHAGRLEGGAVDEIVRVGSRFIQGVMLAPLDIALFEPTNERLATLCKICDYPTIEYPEHREIFFAVPSYDAEDIGNYENLRYHCAGGTNALLRSNDWCLDEPDVGQRRWTDPRLLLGASDVRLDQVAPS